MFRDYAAATASAATVAHGIQVDACEQDNTCCVLGLSVILCRAALDYLA